MLSAVRNFALTFIIALLVLSMMAYYAVNMVLTNISGWTGAPETDSGTESVSPPVTDIGGNEIDIPLTDSGESFNMLIVISDYDPEQNVYTQKVTDLIFGSGADNAEKKPVPTDLASPRKVTLVADSDPEDGEQFTNENGDPIISGGLYEAEYKSIRATQLLLLRFDKEGSRVTFSAFPDDAVVAMEGKYIALGDVYGKYGRKVLCDEIHALTGCIVDKYVVFTPAGFSELVDEIGGVYFNVPCEMTFSNSDGSSLVIGEGNRIVDGASALKILSFDLYFDGRSREDTATEFAEAVLGTLTQITNYPGAEALFEKLSECFDTDLTSQELTDNKDLIFKYSLLEKENKSPVLLSMTVDDEQILRIDERATLTSFFEYRRVISD